MHPARPWTRRADHPALGYYPAVSFDPELQEDLGLLYGKIYEKMQATIDPLALMKPLESC